VDHEPSCIVMRVGEDGKVFSEDVVLKFLELLFSSLGISRQDDMKTISGYVARQQGKIIMTIDMGKGMNLRIEVPSQVKP